MSTPTRTWGRRASDHEPRSGWTPALAIMLAVAVLDWSTKAMVAAAVPLQGFVEVWKGRVALWHVQNPAMVLGLWDHLPITYRQGIAIIAALVALLLLFEIVERGHRLPPHRRIWVWLFIGLAFGGMLGNLGERLIHWYVTDFLSLRWGSLWLPPGNVADLALFLAFLLAIPVVIFELQARSRRGKAHSRHPQHARQGGTLPTSS